MDRLQAPHVAPEPAAEAAVCRTRGEIHVLALEAEHLPMPGSQQAVMAEVMHVLAAWAVRLARQARQAGPEAPQDPAAAASPDLTSSQP